MKNITNSNPFMALFGAMFGVIAMVAVFITISSVTAAPTALPPDGNPPFPQQGPAGPQGNNGSSGPQGPQGPAGPIITSWGSGPTSVGRSSNNNAGAWNGIMQCPNGDYVCGLRGREQSNYGIIDLELFCCSLD